MYRFNDLTINDPLKIIFLCGSKFNNENYDKRIVLKRYLEQKQNIYPLILEENYEFFVEKLKKYQEKIPYSEINLDNLFKVESLTASISDGIIIIHETDSTAAEMGIFATNPIVRKKMCILIPNEYCIDGKSISNFLRLAFFRNNNDIFRIEYFPETSIYYQSENVSRYHTKFYDNKIGDRLGKSIDTYISRYTKKNIKLKISRVLYGKINSEDNTYKIDDNKKKVEVYFNIETIKYYVYSLFTINEYRREIRKTTTINECVNRTIQWFYEILFNTISEKADSIIDGYKIVCSINDFYKIDIKFKQVIAYSLYVLDGIGFIDLPFNKRLSISKNINNNLSQLTALISKENYEEGLF